jgi:aminoglycoside phosphotransferase (APT) family kinase protein
MSARPALGAPLAVGRTAEVYEWADGRVIKLFRPGFGRRVMAEEAAAASTVSAAGLPAPAFHGVEEVDGDPGLVFERVEGPSMTEEILRAPWRSVRLADLLADLHATIHAASGAALRDAGQELERAIGEARGRVDDAVASEALRRLERLRTPAAGAILHGDFHPGNVILALPGPVVIDWLTAASGPPAADVARTLFLLRDAALDGVAGPLERVAIGLVRRRFARRYLDRYRELTGLREVEVQEWRLPILVARVAEGVPSEAQALRDAVTAELRRP